MCRTNYAEKEKNGIADRTFRLEISRDRSAVLDRRAVTHRLPTIHCTYNFTPCLALACIDSTIRCRPPRINSSWLTDNFNNVTVCEAPSASVCLHPFCTFYSFCSMSCILYSARIVVLATCFLRMRQIIQWPINLRECVLVRGEGWPFENERIIFQNWKQFILVLNDWT